MGYCVIDNHKTLLYLDGSYDEAVKIAKSHNRPAHIMRTEIIEKYNNGEKCFTLRPNTAYTPIEYDDDFGA